MKHSHARSIFFALVSPLLVACSNNVTADSGADRLYGRWEKQESTLPPVSLDVRRTAAGAREGQVWLSSVTFTLPALIDDTTIVLANPTSSASAPFVAVLLSDGTLRATLRGTPDVIAVLHKVP